ncbi:MAG: gamma-glutamyltransferase [Pseudomonadota bacterium]
MMDKVHNCWFRRPRCRAFFILILAVGLALSGAQAETRPKPSANALASAHPLATEAGLRVLDEGGNAFDAAVAVTAVLAVVEPYSSGLGGGGFWLLHRASDGFEVMIDGRERAPLAASADMYLDASGKVRTGRSVDGALAAGIPGTVAALEHLSTKYGVLPLKRTLAEAIRLAEQGFPIDEVYRSRARFRHQALRSSPAAAEIFLVEGEIPELGDLIRQPELGAVLRLIAQQGKEGFYRGIFAERLVAGVRQAGGIWTLEDLHQYRIVERKPVYGQYQGTRLTSAAPPSSGGVALVEMLNILSGYPLQSMDEMTRFHLTVEAMRRAYRDRAQYLGDPDGVELPLERLTSPFYAAGLRAGIRRDRATLSAQLPGYASARPQARDTTHFSILDRAGNRVAATLSINYPFGSGFMPPGSGILLNDEMDDFAIKPGSPNVYGLVGAEANAIAPGKRMLSSMTPTFLDDGRRIAILGTPGGSRIITMALLAVLEFTRGGEIQEIVDRPRFHHQYLPDILYLEPGALDESGETALRDLGHNPRRLQSDYGNMQIIIWDRRDNVVNAASDRRGIGAAMVR